MKTDRLIAIIMILLNCEKTTATKLSEIFEVTPRTIYRDIDTIAQAGIPIVTTTGVEGGIGILPAYKVDKQFFSDSDIQSLLMGLSSISTTLPQKELIGTIEKLKTLLPPEYAQDLLLKSNQITIDLTTWMGNKKFIPTLEKLKKALNTSTLVRFDYYNLEGTKTNRVVEPYQLILKESCWYLQGHCTLKNDFRIFKLSRIFGLNIVNSTFIPRDFTPLPLSGKGWIDKQLISIQLRIDASLLEKMIELCGEENIQAGDGHTFIVNFPFVPDAMGYNLLLSFGAQCECLSPDFVRTALKHHIKKLYHMYDSSLPTE
ncbi:MAG: YafY family protein [Niameybacter sp.]|uniref:helix-turn-helix transcriptional regulator n=1 Tax=Niameybacter sp. TaxID=2033640 RepID=UPI002FC72A84